MTIIIKRVVTNSASAITFSEFEQRQSHRKVATQSHRSTEHGLYDSGTAGIELYVKELCGPSGDSVARRRRGTSCLSPRPTE